MRYARVYLDGEGYVIVVWPDEDTYLDFRSRNRAIETYVACDHCMMDKLLGEVNTSTVGRAEYDAQWVDDEGDPSETIFHICGECLAAGDPEGPGYRRVT